jgi:hypothetical protein
MSGFNGDSSLTRETELQGSAPEGVPPNGNFENFPEIDQKTVDTLTTQGIRNLFPIQ